MTARSQQLAALIDRVVNRQRRHVRWNVRHWPSRCKWKPPKEPRAARRLRHRMALYLISLSQRGVLPESFGLGASLLCIGGVVLGAWVIYDDGIDRQSLRSLRRWAARPANQLETAFGKKPYSLVSLTEYNRNVLYANARCVVVGVDLGRSLGLHADWWTPARAKEWRDGWMLGLRGWGVVSRRDGRNWRRSTGRSLVYVQGISAYATRIGFGLPQPSFEGEPRGRRDTLPSGDKIRYAGRFVELLAASHALSGTDSDQIGEHLHAWGLSRLDTVYAVTPNGQGADVVASFVTATHSLALAVDDEAARWAGGLDLRWLWSPGALAQELLRQMGVIAPFAKFHLPDEELACWTEGLHGGWVEAALCGARFPGIDIDARSAYPAVAVLLDWWRYVTAHHVRRRDVTEQFREFLTSSDLADLLCDKATWCRWGLTRVVLRLRAASVPVELPRDDGTSRMYVTAADAKRYHCTWPDAALAALRTPGGVEVLEAVRLDPVGRQEDLVATEVPGMRLDPDEDPAVALVLRRKDAKRSGDSRLAAALRVVVNSLVYGIFCRFDPVGDDVEKPGPFCFPPLAATVAAGCRCLLALSERAIDELGGVVAYRDTDGFIVVAWRHLSGTIRLDNGTQLRALSYDEVVSAMASFDRLDPFGDGRGFFEVKAEGTCGVLGPKKYGILDENGSVVAHTESGIGAFAPPPGFGARRDDGKRAFTADIAAAHVKCAGGLLAQLPWEDRYPDWPAFQRHSYSTPSAAEELPEHFGRRPFAHIVEAIASYDDAHPVALDPGGEIDEADLVFWDGRSGEPIPVSTRPGEGAVVIESLRARAVDWGKSKPDELPAVVVLDDALARRVGKSGALFVDESEQLVYQDIDPAGLLVKAAQHLRAPLFAALSGLSERRAYAMTEGTIPHAATLERAADGIASRLGTEYFPRLLDLVDEAESLSCRWPGCAGRPARTGASWCPLHRRRSGTERRRVLEGIEP